MVKGGPAARARVLRPDARAAVSRARRRAGRVRRGRGAAERGASPGGDRRVVARRGRALDGARRRARGTRWSPAAAEAIAAARRRRSPSGRRSSAWPDGELRLRGRAADAPRRSRRGSTRISTGARPASGRIWTTSGSRPDGRDLRRFGSQGEQRLAVLSLLLAEAELLAERGPAPPLLLLDDVLSELDERRRTALARAAGGRGPGVRSRRPGPRLSRSSRPSSSRSSRGARDEAGADRRRGAARARRASARRRG